MFCCGLLDKSELPASLASVLPADVVARINTLLSNKSLSREQKAQQIDDILKTVPDEVLEKLPEPPHFAQLPTEVKDHLKQMRRDCKHKSIAGKKEAFKAYLGTLPPEQQAILMKE
uniref:Uncharacterized protein n=1 Tax=Globodera rostochiensis TaxID=31243 RepID=A0A914GTN9_GLORO